jgi:signal transduction histidine kinase
MKTTMTDQNRPTQWQSWPVATDPNSVDSRPSEDWSMLVHDLRNPLATVNGYAELLRRRAARGQVQPTDIAQSLRHIQDAVATIERLLDQFRAGPEIRSPGATDLIESHDTWLGKPSPMQTDPSALPYCRLPIS